MTRHRLATVALRRVQTGTVVPLLAAIALLTGCGAGAVAGNPRAAGVPDPTTPQAAGPGTTDDPSRPGDSATPGIPGDRLDPGPVTLVTLGDSLTEGNGDPDGAGFAGRLLDAIAAVPGREGSDLVNLGHSGWTSSDMVDGTGDDPAELSEALTAIADAEPPVLATVLIGSNDMWLLYNDSWPPDETPAEAEDPAVQLYRDNLERTVVALQEAGALVVVGLPDEQTKRLLGSDPALLQEMLGGVSADELARMGPLGERLYQVAAEVAATHGAPTVDTNDPLWSDPDAMAEDAVHPNQTGYAILADKWFAVVGPLL